MNTRKMIIVYILFISMSLSIAQKKISITIRQSITAHNHIKEVKIRKELMQNCSIHMTMIEEDGEIECECVSGYLYYPLLDRCFKPYTRGPCNAGEYFVLQPGKFTAECLPNPCEEGSVFYKNSCHELLKPGPSCDDEKSLVIDEETFELTCRILQKNEIQTESHEVHQLIIAAPIRYCPSGSKRDYRGRCRRGI